MLPPTVSQIRMVRNCVGFKDLTLRKEVGMDQVISGLPPPHVHSGKKLAMF